jgi:CoA:oxalate CoA-transferase
MPVPRAVPTIRAMTQPLEGLRVLELGTFVSAPFTGKLFAGYGAEVIKVEPPGGDFARAHGPFKDGVPNAETSALFLYLNTRKRSVVLDLRTPYGRDAFIALAATADVVIENFRPADLRALGITYEALRAVNPRITLVSITAYGQDGPYANFRANNLTGMAMGGQMYITGTPEGGPLKNGGYQADYQGGLNAFSAATLAVLAAERDGEGQHVDVSVQQCMAPILEAGIPYYSYMGRFAPIRRGNFMASTIGIYPCTDGYVGVHVMPRNWPPFLKAIGREDMQTDPRFATGADRLAHADELMTELATTLAKEQKRDLYRRAGESRAPIAFVHTMKDVIESPQLNARGILTRIDHPVAGEAAYFGPPWWMGPDGWQTGRAPLLGEHTGEVLGELAGLSAAEAARVTADVGASR